MSSPICDSDFPPNQTPDMAVDSDIEDVKAAKAVLTKGKKLARALNKRAMKAEQENSTVNEMEILLAEKPEFLKSFLVQLLHNAREEGKTTPKYFDEAGSYLCFKPNYIPSLDDEKTVDDDPFSTVRTEVREKFESVLGKKLPHPPVGYSYVDNVLYVNGTNEPEAVCSLLFMVALGFNSELKTWAVRIVFLDHFDEIVVLDLPALMLQKHAELVRLLLDKGLRLFIKGGKELGEYLTSLNPHKRMEVFQRQGLVQDSEGYYYFICGEEVLDDEDGKIMYLPSNRLGLHIPKASSGTLDEWKEYVAAPCIRSPLLVFILSLMFVPVIAKALRRSSFAVAFYGNSSWGKTTGIQVGASTVGPGGDPSKNQPSCINSCLHTHNHMTILAQACDSQPMLLDELGTMDRKAVGRLVYTLTSGQEKGRATSTGGSQGIPTWFTIPVLTSETPFLAFVKESEGSVRNGQMARVLDIPVEKDAMMVPADNKMSQAEMSDYLKLMSQTYYGTAFKEFALNFVRWASPRNGWLHDVNQAHSEVVQHYRAQVDKEHEKRAAEHFATVHYAGKLAVNFGVLPFGEDTIAESVQFAFNAWKDALGGKDELDHEVDRLRQFISQNQGNFGNPAAPRRPNTNTGFKFTENGAEYFAIERCKFEEIVTTALSHQRLLQRLDEQGLLYKPEVGRLYGRRMVAGMGKLKLYFINQAILSD